MPIEFTLRKNGEMMVTKSLKVHISEKLVRWVQRNLMISEGKALKLIIEQEQSLCGGYHTFAIEKGKLTTIQMDDQEYVREDPDYILYEE